MKNLYPLLAILFILTGCSADRRSDFAVEGEDGKMRMTKNSRNIITDLLEEFNDCRSSKSLMECKHHTAKAICEFYEIDDFKAKKGDGYVNYEEMHDIIKGKFGTWVMLGEAKSQKALKEAQDKANNGQAVVAVSDRSKYGHVAIILPGSVEKAPSWGGLKAPNCASFFLVKHLEPFVDKSLAYAWSSPKDILLYVKKD